MEYGIWMEYSKDHETTLITIIIYERITVTVIDKINYT